MVPIDSPGLVSYSTSVDFIVVFVIVFEISDIKAIFFAGEWWKLIRHDNDDDDDDDDNDDDDEIAYFNSRWKTRNLV